MAWKTFVETLFAILGVSPTTNLHFFVLQSLSLSSIYFLEYVPILDGNQPTAIPILDGTISAGKVFACQYGKSEKRRVKFMKIKPRPKPWSVITINHLKRVLIQSGVRSAHDDGSCQPSRGSNLHHSHLVQNTPVCKLPSSHD